MNNILHLLGIARKAGKLEIGEEPTGAAARAKQARLILVARDAADNTFRRVRHFADAGSVLWVSVPATKEELGRAVGRTSCAMLAITDVGIAASVAGKLAALDGEKYAITAEKLAEKSARALQRQQEKRRHEQNLRQGRHKSAPAKAPTAKRPDGKGKKAPAAGRDGKGQAPSPPARRPWAGVRLRPRKAPGDTGRES